MAEFFGIIFAKSLQVITNKTILPCLSMPFLL